MSTVLCCGQQMFQTLAYECTMYLILQMIIITHVDIKCT